MRSVRYLTFNPLHLPSVILSKELKLLELISIVFGILFSSSTLFASWSGSTTAVVDDDRYRRSRPDKIIKLVSWWLSAVGHCTNLRTLTYRLSLPHHRPLPRVPARCDRRPTAIRYLFLPPSHHFHFTLFFLYHPPSSQLICFTIIDFGR